MNIFRERAYECLVTLTAARIVLHKELVQSYPAASYTDHHSAAKDPDEAQFLRISKLQRGGKEKGKSSCRTPTTIIDELIAVLFSKGNLLSASCAQLSRNEKKPKQLIQSFHFPFRTRGKEKRGQ